MIDRLVMDLPDWAGPARCPWCERPAPAPCEACVATLPRNRPACTHCAAPLPTGFTDGGCCVTCARQPPPHALAWCAFRYEEPVARQIRALKFHADFAAAEVLGAAIAGGICGRAAALPELLLPVPLHASRLRARGYNQALELARVVARTLRIPLEARLARRVRATEEQTHLGAAERRRNLHGAFRVAGAVTGAHVALLDDVITTGATAAELAAALREAGAARIEVWAAARTA